MLGVLLNTILLIPFIKIIQVNDKNYAYLKNIVLYFKILILVFKFDIFDGIRVLILDGNLEHCAHIWSKSGILNF